MESESAGDSEAARPEPIVFISDASAEAERVSLALSARGWSVADVPLSLLAGRVAVQRPAIIICDADSEGAKETLLKIRQQSPDDPISVVVVGERDGAVASIEPELVRAVFARPVNVQELIGTIERLAGKKAADGNSIAPGSNRKLGTSSRPPRQSAQSIIPRPSLFREGAGVVDPAFALPPELAGEPIATRGTPSEAPVVELSGEIQALLAAAERRLAASPNQPPSGGEDPGPEADVEAVLPPEVLAALEDTLDEDDAYDMGHAVPEAEPGPDGTAALTASRFVGRGQTQHGAGTFATALGTDATVMPPSEPNHTAPHFTAPGTSIQATPHDARPSAPPDTGEESEDARRKRQQASTPKPPKPGAEDLMASDSPDGEPLGSLAPPTAYDPRSSPDSRAVHDARPRLADQAPPPSNAFADYDTAERRGAPSTSPPGRLQRTGATGAAGGTGVEADPRDERGTDRPEAWSPQRRASDRPSAPRTSADKLSERPSAPGADRPSAPPTPEPPAAATFVVPATLREGDAIVALARAIRSRYTGALAFEVDEGIRRVVFREGDFVTAASGVHGESLVAFLAARGDVPPEVARVGHKLPAFGRRAGAALIAHGHLAQDQLWPVLRAHAEWIIARIARIERGAASIEKIGRLEDEPAVFGGATGAEVLVEVVRRALTPEEAVKRLGGGDAIIVVGPDRTLLEECALPQLEIERVQSADRTSLATVLAEPVDPSLAAVVYALVTLGGMSSEAPRPDRDPKPAAPERDEIDDQAMRSRILSRKALVDEGDYFSVLGVARNATAYDIRRAYTTLRREFEPNRALTAQTADLRDVVTEIVDVLEEAYEILSDGRRRERYRRAIEATP